MTKIGELYEAVDDFGLISSAEAEELGVSNAELVQSARRGKFERVSRGVDRVPIWPTSAADPYAIAVKSAGKGAYLYGESVVALLGLTPTDPRKIWIATPTRVRRELGPGIKLIFRRTEDSLSRYEGILCQSVDKAIIDSVPTMGTTRAQQAVEEARRHGYLTEKQTATIKKELAE